MHAWNGRMYFQQDTKNTPERLKQPSMHLKIVNKSAKYEWFMVKELKTVCKHHTSSPTSHLFHNNYCYCCFYPVFAQ